MVVWILARENVPEEAAAEVDESGETEAFCCCEEDMLFWALWLRGPLLHVSELRFLQLRVHEFLGTAHVDCEGSRRCDEEEELG